RDLNEQDGCAQTSNRKEEDEHLTRSVREATPKRSGRSRNRPGRDGSATGDEMRAQSNSRWADAIRREHMTSEQDRTLRKSPSPGPDLPHLMAPDDRLGRASARG